MASMNNTPPEEHTILLALSSVNLKGLLWDVVSIHINNSRDLDVYVKWIWDQSAIQVDLVISSP